MRIMHFHCMFIAFPLHFHCSFMIHAFSQQWSSIPLLGFVWFSCSECWWVSSVFSEVCWSFLRSIVRIQFRHWPLVHPLNKLKIELFFSPKQSCNWPCFWLNILHLFACQGTQSRANSGLLLKQSLKISKTDGFHLVPQTRRQFLQNSLTSFSFGTLHVRCRWNLWHLLERNSCYPQRDLDDESHCQHSFVWVTVMGWVCLAKDAWWFLRLWSPAGAKMTSLYHSEFSGPRFGRFSMGYLSMDLVPHAPGWAWCWSGPSWKASGE